MPILLPPRQDRLVRAMKCHSFEPSLAVGPLTADALPLIAHPAWGPCPVLCYYGTTLWGTAQLGIQVSAWRCARAPEDLDAAGQALPPHCLCASSWQLAQAVRFAHDSFVYDYAFGAL